jgi:Cu+-exporting ATPase
VVFDKTGTLTTGQMRVAEVRAFGADDAATVLGVAAAVERGSEHPIARAIAEHVPDTPAAHGFRAVPGLGAGARVMVGGEEREVLVGRPGWLTEQGLAAPDDLDHVRRAWEGQGGTVVGLGWDGAVRGLVHVTDTVKPTSAPTVARLRALGLHAVLLSGDAQGAADDVATRVGIDEAIGGVLPEGKVDAVRRLQGEGRVVALVGDGVNDAAALAQADLGIAMGSGADVALEAGDLTLMRSDPSTVVDAIALSRRTLRTIKGNLAWAFGYNVAAIPLAMAGLLNPMVAAGAMAFSSVFVVTNSLRLLRWSPGTRQDR